MLDPTCGSGTTAYVAEQWGRRWITIDTSRVALALARTRLMAARYPWYLLADSREGRAKEAGADPAPAVRHAVHNDIRQGFVYERVPHITLKSIANNPLIDDIWEKWQAVLEPLRDDAQRTRSARTWEEWQIPRELPAGAPAAAARSRTPNGGRRASPARGRSTPRSPRAPMSNISTTSPTSTMPASASPARSRSKACRRIACCPRAKRN